ncbi:hypothetical protein V5R04_10800 [Jonesiaceae bacterium BS-20]|uniref:Uncharacterized protein n=1 Tax=Jonesiaceae bacterium BS-20 TaxID=3120821 RepID=A0AAU7DSP4_9MICO
MAEAKSTYVKTMLEDGEITAAEMQDAQGQLISCLTQAGVEASYEDSGYGFGILSFLGEPDQDWWPIEEVCRDQWMGNADFLYQDQVINPQNGDLDSLTAECFVRKGLVAPGFTGKDYQELHAPYVEEVTLEAGETYEAPQPPEILLPGGVSLDDPAAAQCMMTPTR